MTQHQDLNSVVLNQIVREIYSHLQLLNKANLFGPLHSQLLLFFCHNNISQKKKKKKVKAVRKKEERG